MADLSAPPVLSTPDEHLFELPSDPSTVHTSKLSSAALSSTYEIPRTAREIKSGGWKRIGLQFPDHMLVDAPRVVEALQLEIDSLGESGVKTDNKVVSTTARRKIYILADTSYSACCVDEIAAEHVEADVVVHYGRSCLSPTSRLPVIYVYTHHELDYEAVIQEFQKEFTDQDSRVVLMADLTYQDHVEDLVRLLKQRGYHNVSETKVHRDPDGPIPNRKILDDISEDLLKSYSLFHISTPPSSLLLSLSSRFLSLHILETPSSSSTSSPSVEVTNPTHQTASLLRRRFARLLKVATASTIGILVNTLSVSNYLPSIEIIRKKIDRAGKKSYTIVVGKLNPAKLANFSEIEGWVVIGCWESGLIEDEAGQYWRPVITPFELDVALTREEERVWAGEWWGGLERLKLGDETSPKRDEGDGGAGPEGEEDEEEYSDDESAPPEFDLRTGKLVSHTRPMRRKIKTAVVEGEEGNQSLVQRTKPGELATINGVVSPGAEFLRSKRTWQGLGSDFAAIDAETEGVGEESTVVEEGRGGVARGYRVGDGARL